MENPRQTGRRNREIAGWDTCAAAFTAKGQEMSAEER